MILLELNDQSFRKDMGALVERVKKPGALLLVCGRQLTIELKKHFRQRDATNPNKLGGQRVHFWNQVASSVQAPFSGFDSKGQPRFGAETDPTVESDTRVTVSISHPAMAQKYYGGTITAKRTQFLTIPLTAEAYGHTAKDFPGAFLLKTAKGAFIVKYGDTVTRVGKISTAKLGKFRIRASLNFLFKLVRSVNQAADPDALPAQSFLEAAVLARGQQYLNNEFTLTA